MNTWKINIIFKEFQINMTVKNIYIKTFMTSQTEKCKSAEFVKIKQNKNKCKNCLVLVNLGSQQVSTPTMGLELL